MTRRSSCDPKVVSKAPDAFDLIDTTKWTRLELIDALIRRCLINLAP